MRSTKLILFAPAFVLGLSVGQAQTELYYTPLYSDPSLVSYWRLQGNSNDTKGNNNGTDTNVTYSTANGKFGQGAGFSSANSSAISVATTIDLPTGNSPVSINLWFQTSTHDGVADVNLVSWGNNTNDQKTAVIIDTGDHVLFTPWGGQVQNLSKTVTDGLWHMATFTWDGTTGIVYVDGSSASSIGPIPYVGLSTASGSFQIGGNMNGGVDYFNGNIDDVSIFSRALTAIDVSNLYSGNWSQPASGTIDVTTNLPTATFTIAGPATYTGGGTSFTQTNAPVGTYTVTFNTPAGYAVQQPSPQALSAGTIITFTGNYQPSSVYFGPPAPTHPDGSASEPVDTATGNYYTSHVDLTVQGKGLSFSFVRYYNALSGTPGPIGVGWSHSFNLLLRQLAAGVVSIQEADGDTVSFAPTSGGSYSPLTLGVFDVLRENGDGSFTLTRKNQTQLHFSSVGSLLGIVDRNGNTQTMSYDLLGRLSTIFDSSGRSFSFGYDTSNRIVSLTDPIGRIFRYAYDAAGNLASFQDALGAVTQYNYDGNHRMTAAVDPRGTTYLQNTYDSLGRVILQKNARGFATSFSYDTSLPGVTTITDPLGNVTQYVHDASLRLVSVVDALGGIVTYSYTPNNLIASATDQLGRVQTSTYDGNGNLISLTDPNGKTTQFAYDAKNNLLHLTDRLGRTTSFAYDSNDNLLSATDPAGNTSLFTYDSSGEVLTARNARAFTTAFNYNTTGSLIRVIDAVGGTVQMTYDGVGRLLSVENQLANTSTRTYDLSDRLTTVSDPLGDTSRFAYDLNGNLSQITDPDGKLTLYGYDATNKLVRVTDAIGGVTLYAYDGNTNLVGVTDAKGHFTAYAYDKLQRLTTTTDPLGKQKAYGYDRVGNVTSTVDGNTKTNSFTYDALNRLVAMALSDGKSVSYSYDAVGNRLVMTDWHGTTQYVSDLLNRVIGVTTPDGKTVEYNYDSVGNRLKTAYADGNAVQCQYDALNRLTSATDWTSRATGYTYDRVGNLIGMTHPNGTSTLYGYDPANRLVGILNLSGFLPLSGFVYVLDRTGNRTAVVSSAGGVDQYGYDGLYRLTSWTDPIGNATRYSYDSVGNRLTVSTAVGITNYTYDAADQLTASGSTSFTYDGNGNQITKTTGSTTATYGWDALNRLVSVAGGGINTQYQYDGDGNRIRQQLGTGTYQYLNDTNAALPVVLNENGPDGNIDYAYGSSLVSASASSFQSFYQFDGLGSVVNVTDQKGTVVANYAYDPWGQAKTPVAPPFGLDTVGTKNKYRFTGQALDPNDGLVFMRARYYDPSVGRFLSRDPLPRPAPHGNAYLYGNGSPTNLLDPSGLSTEPAGMVLGTTTSATTPQSVLVVPTASTMQIQPTAPEKICVYAAAPEWFDMTSDFAGVIGLASGWITWGYSPFLLDPYGPVTSPTPPLGCLTPAKS